MVPGHWVNYMCGGRSLAFKPGQKHEVRGSGARRQCHKAIKYTGQIDHCHDICQAGHGESVPLLGGILPVLQMLEFGKMQMQHRRRDSARVSRSRWLPRAELLTAPISY